MRPLKIVFASFMFCATSSTGMMASAISTGLTTDEQALEQRIDSILSTMTLEEKVAMLHSKTIMSSEGLPRLGLAEIRYTDGPFGIREEHNYQFQSLGWTCDSATYFPTGSALAATWSVDLAYRYGEGMGHEARLRGKDVVLGPAMNIQRLPVGGRTYEYLSEDPLLTGLMATAYVRGVQEAGTAACLKHYALNNQETNRSSVDVIIDERPMHEIYLRPFEMAVRHADALAVMPSYNKVNGYYGAENDLLNNKLLRDAWGFRGLTVSDWGGTHSTVGSAIGGLDVEMPGSEYFGQALIDSVRAGKVSEDIVNEKVRHILRVRLLIKAVPETEANTQKVSLDEHHQTAYEVARRSIVLLKNEGSILPLDLEKTKKIAIIGLNAELTTATGGIGAGVKTPYEITPLEGIRSYIGDKAELTYAPAYKHYTGIFPANGANATQNIDEPPSPDMLAEAIKAAKEADVVIYIAGTNKNIESEGYDRANITLPVGQDLVVSEIAKVNPNIVSVIVAAGPTDLNTIDHCSPAIVQAWWNGLEGGRALADVLFGKVSPSGKLPFTFPRRLDDSPAFALGTFPPKEGVGLDLFTAQFRKDVDATANATSLERQQPTSHYTEGMLVGYRWYDTKQVPVMYPFGYGLSYATFEYSHIEAQHISDADGDKLEVKFCLSNTSNIEADEVAQLYLSYTGSKVERPKKELKAFQRVTLKAGETRNVTLYIPYENLTYWDVDTHSWQLEHGTVELLLGSSSADIRLTTTTEI